MPGIICNTCLCYTCKALCGHPCMARYTCDTPVTVCMEYVENTEATLEVQAVTEADKRRKLRENAINL